MSDEKQVQEYKNRPLFSEDFKKFLIVTLGTFIGFFFALSLFFALHKPPMHKPCFPPQAYYMQIHQPMKHHHFHKKHHDFEGKHFNKFNDGQKGDFHKKNVKGK